MWLASAAGGPLVNADLCLQAIVVHIDPKTKGKKGKTRALRPLYLVCQPKKIRKTLAMKGFDPLPSGL